MRIPREFQGEFLGKFQENSMTTIGKISRWFQKSYRRIVEEFKTEFQENFRRIPGIISWDTLMYSWRDPGGFREGSRRLLRRFRKASRRLPDLGRFLGTRFTILVLALFHWPLDPLCDGHAHSGLQENQIHCRSFHLDVRTNGKGAEPCHNHLHSLICHCTLS